MKHATFKIVKFFLLLLFMHVAQTTEGSANNLINNSAKAYVAGNITQSVEAGETSEINIGSIITSQGAQNISVQATVSGDIHVQGNASINIGSYID